MQTKHIANTFIALVVIFWIFWGAYFLNEDFRVSIKNIKWGEDTVVKVTDDFTPVAPDDTVKPEEGNNVWLEVNPNGNISAPQENNTDNNTENPDLNIDWIDLSIPDNADNTQNNNPEDNTDNTVKTEILSEVEKKVLDKFSSYNAIHNEIFIPLFGALRDFPTKYETYGDNNSKITIYFFGKQDYTSIKAYFESKKDILNMDVNEVNNFGDNSFYLNSPENNTGRTRIILKKWDYIYWIDMDKNEYNNIKTILLSL